MRLFEALKSKVWWEDTVERALKTFAQGYLGYWVMVSQIAPGDGADPTMADTLLTVDNVKAGAVMTVLSLGSSYISSWRGNVDSPSLLD